jgi:prophage antirepressor-like protein
MENKNQNQLRVFANEQFEVEAREKDGVVEFKIDGIAKSLGFSRLAKSGNESIRWERVNKYLGEFSYPKVGTGDFIPEQYVYLLAMKASNDIAMSFQKWIAFDVLTEIRRNKMYVSPNATIEDKQYNYNMLEVIFSNCSLEKLTSIYKECMDYHAKNKTRIPYAANSKHRKDATHSHADSKLMIMNKIIQIFLSYNNV